jgi:hypothetical protein
MCAAPRRVLLGGRAASHGGYLACDARRVLDGYSRAEYRAHRRSAPVRPHCGCCSGHIKCTRTVRVCACAAPTRAPTPAPTNVGDTNPPTRARTFAPTRGPNFADPTGESDAIDATYLPSLPPFPPFLLPPPPPLPALHSVGPSPRRVTALHALEALTALRLAAVTARYSDSTGYSLVPRGHPQGTL